MFWRRTIYDRAGGLNPAFQLAFDADLWARFSDCGKIGHMACQLSRMRFYPEQKNRRLREQSDREDLLIRARYRKGQAKPSTDYLRRKIALGLRIVWKLLTGCYGPGYRRYLEKS